MTTARDAALVRVKAKAAPAQAPAVDDATVEAFLDSCGLTDALGRTPGEAGWDGPWDENLAIAEVWGTKASLVAGSFNFSADGSSFNKGDLLAKFQALEAQYRGRSGSGGGLGTIRVRGTNDVNTLDSIAQGIIP